MAINPSWITRVSSAALKNGLGNGGSLTILVLSVILGGGVIAPDLMAWL